MVEGCMLYELIPNMPEACLRALMERFSEMMPGVYREAKAALCTTVRPCETMPYIVLIAAPLKHPLISRDSKGLGERPRLLQQLCKAVDEGPEPVLGHVGYQVVERGALAEQGMGAGLDGVGLEVAVHAEALASGTEQGEQDDGEGVEQQQPVAALRIGDAHRA